MPKQSAESAERHHHDIVDPHGGSKWLSDVVLGGQDGLVNVLGVVLGVAGATASSEIVFAAGLAAAVAESVSMAAVAYTAKRAEHDRYRAERAREYRHIRETPNIERDEVRALFASLGLEGSSLDRVVDSITSDPDVWVKIMMALEHGLAPVSVRSSLRSALVVGTASLAGSLIPLVPFALLAPRWGGIASVGLSGATLFSFGWMKGRLTAGSPLGSAVELALIGIVTACIGYLIGRWLEVDMAV